MRFYVFDTAAAAQAAVAAIDARARTIYAAQGYTIAPDGSVVGKRDGVDDPDAQHTISFAPVRQRADGKWVLLHVDYSPAPNFVLDPTTGLTVGQFCTQDFTATVEADDGTWFPDPAREFRP